MPYWNKEIQRLEEDLSTAREQTETKQNTENKAASAICRREIKKYTRQSWKNKEPQSEQRWIETLEICKGLKRRK